ncbi:MAG TPA: hypothetical protein PKE00_06505 [Planctomycetota bacterium]|nr:hypothetical protein [Planctomycetota bacterium]
MMKLRKRPLHRAYPPRLDERVSRDVSGCLRTDSGLRLLSFEGAIFEAWLAELADASPSPRPVFDMGRAFGKNFFEELCTVVETCYEAPIEALALVQFRQVLAGQCRDCGFGEVSLDIELADEGIVFVDVSCGESPPCSAFVGGVVVEALEALARTELDAVHIEDAPSTSRGAAQRLLVTAKERLVAVEAPQSAKLDDVLLRIRGSADPRA